MESLLGFRLDFWDYVTFAVLFLMVMSVLGFLVWLAGLPGRIAIARNHPDAEAVKLMGYAGFLTVVAWLKAFLWAFKPTDIVDIRRFPKEEAQAVAEDIARLSSQSRQTTPEPKKES
ncbi:MAG: superinfection immunity protein [Verrucomicrobiota bacterium]